MGAPSPSLLYYPQLAQCSQVSIHLVFIVHNFISVLSGYIFVISFHFMSFLHSYPNVSDTVGQNVPPEENDNENSRQEEDTFSLSPEVSKKCIDIAQQYQVGNIDKVEAMVQIQQAIPHTEVDQSRYVNAIRAYHQMLDSFERFCDRIWSRHVCSYMQCSC